MSVLFEINNSLFLYSFMSVLKAIHVQLSTRIWGKLNK